MAQSGCLPFGSLLTNMSRQSATRCRYGGLLSFGSQHKVISWPRLPRPSPSRQQPRAGVHGLAFSEGGSELEVLQESSVKRAGRLTSACNAIAFWPCTCASGRIWASQRECGHAKVKHLSAKQGLLALIGCAFAPQPNLAVKWDADKLHRLGTALWAPLTLALGFWQQIRCREGSDMLNEHQEGHMKVTLPPKNVSLAEWFN